MAQRALPALRRSEKEDGHRPSEFLIYNKQKLLYPKRHDPTVGLSKTHKYMQVGPPNLTQYAHCPSGPHSELLIESDY